METRPFIIRALTGAHLIWALSIDRSTKTGLIERNFDVPSMRSPHGAMTDQNAMRRDLIMTESQHIEALLARHPGATLEAAVGNGNLGANPGFVGCCGREVVFPPGGPVYQKRFAAL